MPALEKRAGSASDEAMPRRYGVLGSGLQGTAAGWDLVAHGEATLVRMLDRDPGLARAAAERLASLAGRDIAEAGALDATDGDALVRSFAGLDGVLSAVPYPLNPGVAAAAVRAGVHFCDLGGNTDVSRRVLALDGAARKAGVSVVPDCGVAPGLANVLAALGIARQPAARSVRIRCGGLPEHPRPPLGYQLVFNIGGLTNEYTGEAEVLEQGRLIRIPACTALEEEDFGPPLGRLEAFVTSGGTSTAPETWAGRLETYEYKTLRYPGHFERMRTIIDLGLLDRRPLDVGGVMVAPRDVFHACAGPRLTHAGEPDLLILRVDVAGPGGALTRFELLDRADPQTGFSAMERCTAFPAAATLQLQVSGRIPAGASPPERAVPAAELLAAVRSRGLAVVEHGPDARA